MQIVETSRRGHATRFAQDAASRGVDVVDRLRRRRHGQRGRGGHRRHARPRWRVLPGGSTNVFARSIGLPNDPVAAAKELVPALKDRHFRRVGLGMVNGRYFCFHTGVGYDAAVVREVEKRASVKRWVGHPLFIYAALRTWFSKLRPDAAPLRGGAARRRDVGAGRLLHGRAQHQPLHLPRQPRLRPQPLRQPRPRARGHHVPQPAGAGPSSPRWPARCAGSAHRDQPHRRRAPRPGPTRDRVRPGRSRTRSTATTWARPAGCASSTDQR